MLIKAGGIIRLLVGTAPMRSHAAGTYGLGCLLRWVPSPHDATQQRSRAHLASFAEGEWTTSCLDPTRRCCAVRARVPHTAFDIIAGTGLLH